MGRVTVTLLAAAGLVACGAEAGAPDAAPRPPPLPPLPAPSTVDTDRFADATQCAQCHRADPAGGGLLRDAAGRDISPVSLWRASMMALAARDPFFLAVVAEERAHASAPAAIDRACLRCHAPAGHEESDGALGFDQLVAGDDAAARIGREGVTCTLCHQIDDRGLGGEASFSGGFEVGFARELWGPHAAPRTDPMEFFVGYRPAQAAHVTRSELCGTCHTVIVGGVVEQATYLEWRASAFAVDTPCQACHVPTVDEDGVELDTPIARFPDGLLARTPYVRHVFVGGNAYLLRLLAANEAWAQTGVPADDLEQAARRAEAHLRTAATLEADAVTASGFRVVVRNRTGHKLPTGYPSRRMWLRVTVRDADAVVWSSGLTDADGRLPDDGPGPRRHTDVIADASSTQVWQAELLGDDDAPTHRATAARRVGKDDRILPDGFAPTGLDVARTAPVGVDGDPDFGPGADGVRFELPALPLGAAVSVELVYQTLSPELIETIDLGRTPASTRFVDMARARAPTPIVIATLDFTLP